MSEMSTDPVVQELREQITAADREIVEAVNRRLELVAALRDHKVARGYDLVDPARESWLIAYLEGVNRGPLSAEGLRRLHAALLDVTKRELALAAEAKTR